MHRSLRLTFLFAAIACLVATGTAIVVASDYLATLAYYRRAAISTAWIVDLNLRRLAQGAEVALGRATDLVQRAGGSSNLRDLAAWHSIRAYLDPVIGADSIWVVDRHGEVMLESSTFPNARTVNVADRAYFAAAKRNTALFIGPAIHSRFTGRTVVTLTRGLLDRDGQFDGLVGITVEADWLSAFHALLESETRRDIGVLRDDGGIVIANREPAALIDRPPAGDSYWRRLTAPAAAADLRNQFDPAGYLVAVLAIPAYELKVIVRVDAEEALAHWVVRARNTAAVAMLGALSLFALMLFGIRSFERERAAVAAARQATADLAMARHDSLTGLASRGLFFELSTAAAAQAARRGDHLGALYIDLDGFKLVNDRLGHDRGDEVLVETAAAITDAIREADIAGRIGGDEFVVYVASPPETIDRAMRDVAERIRVGISTIGDGIACSIGIAHGSAQGADLPALLRRADAAMREAKARGKNRVVAA